jgi:SAM-dependent methyltransferase
MSTIPSSPPPVPPLDPRESHRARQVAESFGADAGRYDRTRPRYPKALVERIVAASPGRDVLDVGCGTGIAARQFQAAGCRVLGVDPDARMAGFARRSGVEAEVATFEDWEAGGRDFDLVIAAQAWHWVDPVAGAAKAARVLRPDGRLALLWYVFQPAAELAQAFSAVYRRVLPGTPFAHGVMPGLDSYSAFFTKAIDGMRQAGGFSDAEQWRFDSDRSYSRQEWLEQVPTFGGHSTLPPSAQAELLAGIGGVIDAAGGGFTMAFTAVAVTATVTATRV